MGVTDLLNQAFQQFNGGGKPALPSFTPGGYALKSLLFTLPRNQRLIDCANWDPNHIAPMSSGDHVRRIQEALEWLADVGELDVLVNEPDGYFGPNTEIAVLEYKKKHGIVRPGKEYDSVVGIGTLRALDLDMARLGGSSTTPPPTPPAPTPDAAVKFRDVIVVLSMPGHRREVQNAADLEKYVSPRVMSEAYQGKKDRGLTIIAAFASQPAGAVTSVVSQVTGLPLADGQQLGQVMLYGVSFGGRQILAVARSLIAARVAVEYVGVADGAFFHSDTTNIPRNPFFVTGRTFTPTDPLAKISPSFTPAGVRKTRNVFQTKGNLGKITLGRNQWTSTMGNAQTGVGLGEIHGSIPGMTDDDVTVRCVQTAHNALHTEAARMGEDSILGDMRGLLVQAGDKLRR